MPKRAYISLIVKVTGNVNADAGVGTRIPLKKIVTWDQKIKPFVSARSIRRAIRERLAEKGFEIDPLQKIGEQREYLADIGNPIKYIDDDLFGYFAPNKGTRRVSPIKTSHLISLTHTEINVEFAARFPRDFVKGYEQGYPAPFEIELAEWLGKLDIIISDRIGRFYKDEIDEELEKELEKNYKDKLEKKTIDNVEYYELKQDERKKRLKSFLEVVLLEGWQLPRAAQNISVPDFYYAVIVLTDKFVPLAGYVGITSEGKIDEKRLSDFMKVYTNYVNNAWLIDYKSGIYRDLKQQNTTQNLDNSTINSLIENITEYIIS